MRPYSRGLSAFALIVAASVSHAQSVAPKKTIDHLVDSLAKDFIASHGSPAVSIGVFRGTDTLAVGGWGKADIENDVAATPRSVYRIGSITK